MHVTQAFDAIGDEDHRAGVVNGNGHVRLDGGIQSRGKPVFGAERHAQVG